MKKKFTKKKKNLVGSGILVPSISNNHLLKSHHTTGYKAVPSSSKNQITDPYNLLKNIINYSSKYKENLINFIDYFYNDYPFDNIGIDLKNIINLFSNCMHNHQDKSPKCFSNICNNTELLCNTFPYIFYNDSGSLSLINHKYLNNNHHLPYNGIRNKGYSKKKIG